MQDSAPPPAAAEDMTLENALLGAQNMQRHGDLDRAEAVYQRILELVPEEPNALHFLGVLRMQQRRHVEAVQLIQRAIAAAPGVPGMWVNLGNVHLDAGRFDEAIDAYHRASELAPDSLYVYNNLGLLQARRGNLDLAEAAYRHALTLAPDAEYVLNNYAVLLTRQQRYEEATSHSLKAITVDPADPRARRTLSICYSLVGDMASAQKALQVWLDMDPGNPEALHLLAAAGGLPTPERATDAFVVNEFDSFARTFDAKLELLGYRAPALVGAALAQALGGSPGEGAAGEVLDAGCGTGLCAPVLRPWARRLDGVDLSQGMLDKAVERGGYDSLVCAELGGHVLAHPAGWDTIVSADTLCYFGDLRAVLQGCAAALRPGGTLVFSVEATPQAASGYLLQHHGRYAHTRAYLEDCLRGAGLRLLSITAEVLRQEVLRPVQGWVVSARAA